MFLESVGEEDVVTGKTVSALVACQCRWSDKFKWTRSGSRAWSVGCRWMFRGVFHVSHLWPFKSLHAGTWSTLGFHAALIYRERCFIAEFQSAHLHMLRLMSPSSSFWLSESQLRKVRDATSRSISQIRICSVKLVRRTRSSGDSERCVTPGKSQQSIFNGFSAVQSGTRA